MIKIILSRKGFDSANGGHPSIIFPDGTLLSLPIPSLGGNISYSDLKVKIGRRRISLLKLMKQLFSKITYDEKRIILNEKIGCHLDPDIFYSIYPREDGWKGAFGQVGAAQRHLEKQGIGKDDVFLFFGWFKKTVFRNKQISYLRGDWDKHVIFGYLQVEKIIKPDIDPHKVPSWLKNHPHVNYLKDMDDYEINPTNTIYIARKSLSWDKSKKGWGVFKFNHNLILTKKGLSRSKWKLPREFKNVKISYHSSDSWKKGYFQSASIGQEFVIETNELILKWAKNLINSNS